MFCSGRMMAVCSLGLASSKPRSVVRVASELVMSDLVRGPHTAVRRVGAVAPQFASRRRGGQLNPAIRSSSRELAAAIGYRLSAIGYQLSAVGYCLLAYWLS